MLSDANPILVALDLPDRDQARALRRSLVGVVGGVKIGKEFFTAEGPEGVREVVGDTPLFLDLKFHDIPNTVAGALRAALRLRPFMVNLHASGGPAMMKAAAAAVAETAAALSISRPLLVAVTVLTSLDEADLMAVGQQGPVPDQVERLARLAKASGLDGVVCSPREVGRLRAAPAGSNAGSDAEPCERVRGPAAANPATDGRAGRSGQLLEAGTVVDRAAGGAGHEGLGVVEGLAAEGAALLGSKLDRDCRRHAAPPRLPPRPWGSKRPRFQACASTNQIRFSLAELSGRGSRFSGPRR